eukprot:gene25445-30724_t
MPGDDWADDVKETMNLCAGELTPDDSFGLRGRRPHEKRKENNDNGYIGTFDFSRQPGRGGGDSRPRNQDGIKPLLALLPPSDSMGHSERKSRTPIVPGRSLSTNQQIADLSSLDMPPPQLAPSHGGSLPLEPKYPSRRISKKRQPEVNEGDMVQDLADDDDEAHIVKKSFTTTRGSTNLLKASNTSFDLLQNKMKADKAKMTSSNNNVNTLEDSWLGRRDLSQPPDKTKKVYQPPKAVPPKFAEPPVRQSRSGSAQKTKNKEPETIDLLDSDEDAPGAHSSLSSAKLPAPLLPIVRKTVKMKMVFFGLLCYQSTKVYEQHVSLMATNEVSHIGEVERKVYWEFCLQRANRVGDIQERIRMNDIKSIRCGELELGASKYPSITIDLDLNTHLKHVAIGAGKVLDPFYSAKGGVWTSGKYVVLILDSDQKLQDLKATYEQLGGRIDSILTSIARSVNNFIEAQKHNFDNQELFDRAETEVVGRDVLSGQDVGSSGTGRSQRRRRLSDAMIEGGYSDPKDRETFLIYPIEYEATDTITIYVGDLKRLSPGVYFNDNLIDLKIKHLISGLSPEQRSKVYAFNCHFYTKLTEECKRGTWKSDVGHKLVRRWTKHVDLFSMDFVFFPINLSLHWSLVVLARPYLLWEDPLKYALAPPSPTTVDLSREEELPAKEQEEGEEKVGGVDDAVGVDPTASESKGSDQEEPRSPRRTRVSNKFVSPMKSSSSAAAGSIKKKAAVAPGAAIPEDDQINRPALLFLDSLSMHSHTKIGKHIAGYLYHEWLAKRKQKHVSDGPSSPSHAAAPPPVSEKDFVSALPPTKCHVPPQQNGFDCGVYVVKYVEQVLKLSPSTTAADLKGGCRSQLGGSFTQQEVDEERVKIRSLLEQTREDWVKVKQERQQESKEQKEDSSKDTSKDESKKADEDDASTSTSISSSSSPDERKEEDEDDNAFFQEEKHHIIGSVDSTEGSILLIESVDDPTERLVAPDFASPASVGNQKPITVELDRVQKEPDSESMQTSSLFSLDEIERDDQGQDTATEEEAGDGRDKKNRQRNKMHKKHKRQTADEEEGVGTSSETLERKANHAEDVHEDKHSDHEGQEKRGDEREGGKAKRVRLPKISWASAR